MQSIKSNEREFQSQFINWLVEQNRNNNSIFDTVTGETSLLSDEETSKFPDVVVWNNRKEKEAFIFLELKPPGVDIENNYIFENAKKKIEILKTRYFGAFNLKKLLIYEYDKKKFNLIKAYPQLKINNIEEWLNENNKIEMLDLAGKFFYDIIKLKYEGHLYYEGVDEYFIRKLLEITAKLKGYYKKHLEDIFSKNYKLKSEVYCWLVRQGILIRDIEKSEREKFYDLISSQIVYQFIGRIIFYETIRSRLPKQLEAVNTQLSSAAELEKELKEKFERVKSIDYYAVFESDIPDRIPLPEASFEILKEFIEDIIKYNFSNLKQEVLGNIFQNLIPASERHKLGQYFTKEDLVDIINGFCIKTKEAYILDPTCGTGTFLIRAYDRFYYNFAEHNHCELLERIWGCELAPFPAELAVINLYRQNISEYNNFPRIIKDDFFNITTNSKVQFPPNKKMGEDKNYKIEMALPEFDAIVGNFPFIRQEEIEKLIKGYRRKVILPKLQHEWANNGAGMDLELFEKNGDIKISKKADIYAFMYIHSAALLKEGGRLGFVTSSSYLDTEFGDELKLFFLRNFKIVAIVESRVEPWFTDASVNTVFTILEKCSNKKDRAENIVKFVSIKKKLKELLPFDKQTESINRHHHIDKLIAKIEYCVMDKLTEEISKYENENYRIRGIEQKNLEKVKFKWSALLRNPDLFFELYTNKKMIDLRKVIQVKYGIKPGIVKFFIYSKNKNVMDYYKIEKKYLKPFINSFKEFEKLVITKKDADDFILSVNKEKRELLGEKVLDYIEWGEQQRTKEGVLFSEVPSVKNNEYWYGIKDLVYGDVILPQFWDMYFYYPYNKGKIPVSNTVFTGKIKKEYDKKFILALLNSTLMFFITECNGRINMGEGVLTTYGPDMKRYFIIPDPSIFSKKDKKKLIEIYDKLCKRKIKSIFDEVKMRDRQMLDKIILRSIWLDDDKILDKYLKILYKGLTELVEERKALAKMRDSIKKNGIKESQKNLKDRVMELIIKPNFRKFPSAFLPCPQSKINFKDIQLSNGQIRIGSQFLGEYEIFSGDKKIFSGTLEQGKYLQYAYKKSEYIIKIPNDNIIVRQTVQSYEIYLKEIEQQIFDYLINRTGDTTVTNKIIQEIMREIFNK